MRQANILALIPAYDGTFSNAFPELASASASFSGLSIKGVAARLNDQAPKGTQLFEALGFKVPSTYITRWGLVILLCVMFYFWLHSHEFNNRASPSSPGLDVAWIGVYKSCFALVTMLLSACIAPAIALTLMLIKAPRDLPADWYTWAKTVYVLALGISSLLLVIGIGERVWELRKLKTDS